MSADSSGTSIFPLFQLTFRLERFTIAGLRGIAEWWTFDGSAHHQVTRQHGGFHGPHRTEYHSKTLAAVYLVVSMPRSTNFCDESGQGFCAIARMLSWPRLKRQRDYKAVSDEHGKMVPAKPFLLTSLLQCLHYIFCSKLSAWLLL